MARHGSPPPPISMLFLANPGGATPHEGFRHLEFIIFFIKCDCFVRKVGAKVNCLTVSLNSLEYGQL